MAQSADSYLQLPRRRYFSALEMHAAGVGTIAAMVLLVGYGFGFAPMQTIIAGFPPMRPGTSFAFMLLSVAYLMSLRGSREALVISSALGVAVVLWTLNLAFSNRGLEEGADIVTSPVQATLLSLIAGGVAILLINHAPRLRIVTGVLALLAATPALYRILGLLFFWGAPPQQGSLLGSMAIHTAVLIVWFMSICILLHPALGFGAAIQQASLRGRLLRRALPFVVFVPVLASVSGLVLSVAFGWSVEFLFALAATISVTLGVTLIWWLSQLVAAWQQEANERSARLSRANEALEQYASSAAHDLKAPARHVLLYGELLEEALAKGDAEAGRRYARSIRESALEMPKIIDGMLEFSRSSFTRITLTDNSLSELVQAAAAQLASDLEQAGAQVTVVREARLRCDSTLMTTVFQNLIANAIKNRRRDRPLTVRIDCIADEHGQLLSVEDNGVGFQPEFAAVAFNPLARGTTATGEGAGIGLATCRSIIRSHGGEIRVEPSIRQGARIEFTLPDARNAPDTRQG